jgi:hypothetical protein
MTTIYLVINPRQESNYSAIIKLGEKRLHGMGETPDQAIENVCELHENETC